MIGRDECPFCDRLSRGEWEEHWHNWDYPRITTAMFTPLNPVTEGHKLFVPMHHTHPHSSAIAGTLTIRAMHYAKDCGGDYNLILNQGESASQSIEHMHLHYVPRREGDGLKLPWTGQVKA